MDKKDKRLRIRLTSQEYDKLRWLSIKQDKTKSEIVRKLLHKEFIEQVERENRTGGYELFSEFLKKYDAKRKG